MWFRDAFSICISYFLWFFFFFFNDTATTEIYTLSLHDALPIFDVAKALMTQKGYTAVGLAEVVAAAGVPKGSFYYNFKSDRKSTRLNSSHLVISYAVFCLKKKRVADSACCRHITC